MRGRKRGGGEEREGAQKRRAEYALEKLCREESGALVALLGPEGVHFLDRDGRGVAQGEKQNLYEAPQVSFTRMP